MWRALVLLAVCSGCSGSVREKVTPDDAGAGGSAGSPTTAHDAAAGAPVVFEALPPEAYLAKVKDVLTGLPPDDEELRAVKADAGALRGLIDGWMKLPSFRSRMLEFFQHAFQQTQLDITDFEDTLEVGNLSWPAAERARFVRAVSESFARTALALVDEGRPFTDVATTQRFMLNVPLMVTLAYVDAVPKDESLRHVAAAAWPLTKFPGFKYVQLVLPEPGANPDGGAPADAGPRGDAAPASAIPFEQSLDPRSPRFGTFTVPAPRNRNAQACPDRSESANTNALKRVFGILFGGTQGCGSTLTQFTDEDWNNYRMVTVRKPRNAEERTLFWDLAKLRDAKTTELVVALPRVGFFTTLAFFANWPTNDSNQFRVTTNQALITGLARSFDDRQTTVILTEGDVDALHVEPGTACYACHQRLDPMRDFFAQSYSYAYFPPNLDPKKTRPLPAMGVFHVDDAPAVSGNGVEAFGQAMASHPAFAPAWVTKLCAMANAAPCDELDPEVQRVGALFRDSRFDFRTLVRETMASPLVTFASTTFTSQQTGVVIAIARREAFCARLEARLAIPDVCNQRGESGLPKTAATARNLSLGIPGGGYVRGDLNPLLPHDPNLFSIAGSEKLCALLASSLVDAGTASRWKSTARAAAIQEFSSVVMGLAPTDARTPAAVDLLTRHADAAVAAKATATDALRSTFVVACSSQLATSSGL